MQIVFFGTPAFAAEYLAALIADPFFTVVAVVCQPDEPLGRKKVLTSPPTKLLAHAHGIPVLQPTKLKEAAFPEADVYVVVAYGRIIPQRVLDIPRHGCVNVHPSLLPRLRGPSPIASAIADGETTTGVTIMQLDAAMDHGPILAQTSFPIAAQETTATLTRKVVSKGAPLLLETLKHLDNIAPREQDHAAATFCKLLTREDGLIDWQQPAEVIERHIRAYHPWPGSFTVWQHRGAPLNVKIFSAQIADVALAPGSIRSDDNRLFVGTATAALEILELQPASGSRMPAAAFIAGYADVAASR